LRVFIVPSWYPSEASSVPGSFIYDQARALVEVGVDLSVVVSLWGQGSVELSPRHLLRSLRALTNHLSSPRRTEWQSNGVDHLLDRRLTWSHRLPLGGIGPAVAASERNMDRAMAQYRGMDLIHAHVSYPAGYIASQLSKRYGVPYIITEHMGPFPFPGMMRDGKPMVEITTALASAKATVAVSPALADRIEAFGYHRPIVIPNLVDEREFRLHPPIHGRFSFLTVCGMSEQKGIDDLLRAVALWDPPASAVEFLFVGDGPKLGAWKRMADDLGVSDRVRWLGGLERRDVGSLFMGCNAFVLPSRHETFGVVLAEAAASGKPLVATRCGGPESIVNEINGLLVDVGDVSGLADALRSVSSEWPNYDAEAIRQDCLMRFGRRPVVDQITDLYRTVVGDA